MFSNSNKQTKGWLATAAASLILFAFAAPSAEAVVLDSNVYAQYQTLRTRLLSQEANLLRDYDDLQKKIDTLNRQNVDRSLTPTIDGLSKTLDKTFDDLRKVRQDIKVLETQML